ncbi:sugar transferase [Chitinophagaceae bacterium LWZ2-11]
MINDYSTYAGQAVIALVNLDDVTYKTISAFKLEDRPLLRFKNGIDLTNNWEKYNLNIVAVISQSEVMAPSGITLAETLHKKNFSNAPIMLICAHLNTNSKLLALKAGISDVFKLPLNQEQVEIRTNFLIDRWPELKAQSSNEDHKEYKTPAVKRMFDIFFSGMALLFLSPFFLIVYLLIRLESKGPAFYYSLRVGTGYNIFKFYKFRSMYVDADKRLKDLKHLNQYNNESVQNDNGPADDDALCNECKKAGIQCQFPVYADKARWCEKEYMGSKKAKSGSAFFKLKDDPRITKVGKFIRNTSIDELPQLWNVFIGNMSIVGNRPLPLYEAEKLTTDKYALRFMAPAGITGLWQVEKRGKGEMSEEERLMLDNVYAENHSFKSDVKLIMKTIPALFQKENV